VEKDCFWKWFFRKLIGVGWQKRVEKKGLKRQKMKRKSDQKIDPKKAESRAVSVENLSPFFGSNSLHLEFSCLRKFQSFDASAGCGFLGFASPVFQNNPKIEAASTT